MLPRSVATGKRATGIVARKVAAPRGSELENDLAKFHRTLPGWYVTRNLADRAKGKKGEPDYTAIPPYLSPHKVVMFDAKSTRVGQWPISLLAQHQAVAFARMCALGHQAGVYLRLGSGPNAGDWWLPWADLDAGWNAWWTKRETFYPVPTRRIVAMDWTRAVGT